MYVSDSLSVSLSLSPLPLPLHKHSFNLVEFAMLNEIKSGLFVCFSAKLLRHFKKAVCIMTLQEVKQVTAYSIFDITFAVS